MTDTDIHSCGYYCDRPACIVAQRNELRDKMFLEQEVKTYSGGKPNYTHPIKREPILPGGGIGRHPDGVVLTNMRHPENLAVDEDADVNPDSLETIEIDLPEPEPVAWMNPNEESDGYAFSFKQQGVFTVPLYAAPPKKEWQGLTDEEIENCFEMSMFGTCRAIEAKLKEKNNAA